MLAWILADSKRQRQTRVISSRISSAPRRMWVIGSDSSGWWACSSSPGPQMTEWIPIPPSSWPPSVANGVEGHQAAADLEQVGVVDRHRSSGTVSR